jgi:hypothetical protein
MTLQDLFGYANNQLWITILVGNFTTYALAAMYQFPGEIAKLVGF